MTPTTRSKSLKEDRKEKLDKTKSTPRRKVETSKSGDSDYSYRSALETHSAPVTGQSTGDMTQLDSLGELAKLKKHETPQFIIL